MSNSNNQDGSRYQQQQQSSTLSNNNPKLQQDKHQSHQNKYNMNVLKEHNLNTVKE